jgi:glycine oxidase
MTSSNTTDVAIIGGGIMGSAVALRLAQRGVGVTVVERGIPGAEASSAAAGILGPQMEAEGPGPLLELGLASRALYPSLAAELRDATGIDVGYDRSGVLAVALDDAGELELVNRRAWQQRRSLNVGWLTGDEVPASRRWARRSAPRSNFPRTRRSSRASWHGRFRKRRRPRARAF